MPAQLRGRAESVRTVLRSALVALAPTLFGIMSAGLDPAHGSTGARGLKYTLLIMLAALVISGLILALIARRTYVRDVATALASEQQAPGSNP